MASRLNPYLNFDGTAREAMEFYRDALGGELVINTFAEFGAGQAAPDGAMHAQLETPAGFTLMASDAPPGMEVDTRGGAMSASISGDAAEQLRRQAVPRLALLDDAMAERRDELGPDLDRARQSRDKWIKG